MRLALAPLVIVAALVASAAARAQHDGRDGERPDAGDDDAGDAADADGGSDEESPAVEPRDAGAGSDGGLVEDAPHTDAGATAPTLVDEPRAPDAPVADEGGLDDADAWGVVDEPPADLGETTVVGDVRQRRRLAGSAHVIDEEALERQEYDDVHRVLKTVPGVYVRDEDGFGLRPNIGLRGATADRSAKVTLMEDGVLLGPAPYSAPAAYYFPLTTRMVGVEVFKGPAAIKAGPHTVGGAINMRTRRIPQGFDGGVDVAAGRFASTKLHGHVGYGIENVGVLLEGARLTTDGFKELDGGGPTGFARDDVMVKGRLNTNSDADYFHGVELKLGWQDEDSHETYLGLTDEDFAKDPYRRYRASQLDRMQWTRVQLQGSYLFRMDGLAVEVTGYRHNFHRSWFRVDGMRSGPGLGALLADPAQGQNAVLLAVLRGDLDSEGITQAIVLANNDRAFFSQGVQTKLTTGFTFFGVRQDVEVGARVHQDQIERTHTAHGYLMQGGRLVPDGLRATTTVHNREDTTAGALYVLDEIDVGGFVLFTPGIRFELVRGQSLDLETGVLDENLQLLWLPGAGISTSIADAVHLFAGIYKGGSPVAPGQGDDVLPEESLNVEAGARLLVGDTVVEGIGFASHYRNLNATCTLSTGCDDVDLGRQFSAGEVFVGGLELTAGQRARLLGFEVGGDLAYTWTESRFLTAFSSPNPQWGEVEAGFELPYVPRHQGALSLLAAYGGAEISTVLTGMSSMRDVAGVGPVPPGTGTDPQVVLDLRARAELIAGGSLYFNVDNALSTTPVVARRPYGARPAKPFSFMVGYKQDFGRLF